MRDLGTTMQKAIFESGGKFYENIAAYELYPAAGTASDWFYGDAGFLGYCIELRDKGEYGITF